jgi:hypothetical protein
MKLSPVQQKFVLHRGEMGTRWGINRTVAQMHALLHISPKPLNAEEIAATLEVARSNVSTSLKELHRFFETTTARYAQVAELPASALVKFLRTGDKVLKTLGFGSQSVFFEK